MWKHLGFVFINWALGYLR